MKTKYISIIIFVALIATPLLALLSMKVFGENCIKVHVPRNTMIYSESNLATNYLAKLHSNDVLYFCGE